VEWSAANIVWRDVGDASPVDDAWRDVARFDKVSDPICRERLDLVVQAPAHRGNAPPPRRRRCWSLTRTFSDA